MRRLLRISADHWQIGQREAPAFSDRAVKVFLPAGGFVVLDRGWVYGINQEGLWCRTHPDFAQ